MPNDQTDSNDLRSRLDRLERRLDRLERALELPPVLDKTMPGHIKPEPQPPRIPPLAGHGVPSLPGTPTATRGEPAKAPPTTPQSVPRPAVVPAAQPRPAAKKKPRETLEVRIGLSWTAWVGAIVIVLGAGFFASYAYEQGWWSSMTAMTRFLMVAGFGAALLGLGELALRKISKPASVGLFGAGLGVLYLDAFAAFGMFKPPIVSREWAFVLMAVVAIVGVLVTLRTKFRTIGVLSLLGGYLVPFWLRGGSTHMLEVGLYLTMLLGIALTLSTTMPKHFRPLRYVALGCHAAVGLGWAIGVIGAATTDWFLVLAFITLWWGAVAAETLVAALRNQSAIGNPVAAVLATAWFVTIGCFVLHDARPAGIDWLGVFTAGIAVAAALIAFGFGPPVTQKGLRSPMDKLAVAMWAQAGVLLAVAVALQFDGYGETIGWLAIGLASVETGRRLKRTAVEWFGLVVGGLAGLRVVGFDWWVSGVSTPVATIGSVTITGWSILAVATILVALVMAHRLQPHWRAMPVLLTTAAAFGWLGTCIVACQSWSLPAAWLAGATTLVVLERFGRRQRYMELGLVMLVFTAVIWSVLAITERFVAGFDPAARSLLLNAQMGVAAAMVLVGWLTARKLSNRSVGTLPLSEASTWQFVFVAASMLLLGGLSLEIDRVVMANQSSGQLRQLLLTALWALGAVAIGAVARVQLLRRTDALAERGPELLIRWAWAIMLLVTAKWLLWDTAWWGFVNRSGGLPAMPLVNLQMFVAMLLGGCAITLRVMTLPASGRTASFAQIVAPAAAIMLLWGLTFEVDRMLVRWEAAHDGELAWNSWHLRAMWWTALWALGGLAMMLGDRLRRAPGLLAAGWGVLVLSGCVWLVIDTFAFRLQFGAVDVIPVFNVQFLVGVVVAALVGVGLWHVRGRREPVLPVQTTLATGLTLIGLIGLWLGSLEIDRFFAAGADVRENAAMARQAGFSIWWGLYALTLIALGFARRVAMCRYAGLALLAVTAVKVLTVDMAEVEHVYRVLSFIGVGLLMVLTSVGYAKLAPRLQGRVVTGVSDPATPR